MADLPLPPSQELIHTTTLTIHRQCPCLRIHKRSINSLDHNTNSNTPNVTVNERLCYPYPFY